MAEKYKIQLSSSFDYQEVIKGLGEIKKQLSSIHVGDDIAKDLKKSLEKIELDIPDLKGLEGATEISRKEADKYIKILDKLNKEIQKFSNQLNDTDFTESFSKIDTTKLDELNEKIERAEARLKESQHELAETFISTNFEGNSSKTIENAILQLFEVDPDEIKNKFEEIETNTKTEYEESINRMEQLLRNSKANDIAKSNAKIIDTFYGEDSKVEVASGKHNELESAIRVARKEILELAEGSDKARGYAKELLDLLNDPKYINKNNDPNATVFGLPSLQQIQELEQVKLKIDDIQKVIKENQDIFTPDQAEIINLLAEKVKLLEERFNSLESVEKNTKEATDDLSKKIEEASDNMNKGAKESDEYRIKNQALEATFGSLAHRIESTVSALAIFNKSMQIVRNAVKSVEELDAAFTQIAIVSEQSSEQAWKLFDDFNKLAKQYSITTKDLTEGAKLFYQQGLSAADTMKMVEASTVSAALGEVTMTEAANTLTAAIQGYNESAAVAMDYTDKIAMVGAVSAADFNELSTAMKKTASSAYTAGIDFDHLLGYLGKMIEVTREAPRKYYKNIIFS